MILLVLMILIMNFLLEIKKKKNENKIKMIINEIVDLILDKDLNINII